MTVPANVPLPCLCPSFAQVSPVAVAVSPFIFGSACNHAPACNHALLSCTIALDPHCIWHSQLSLFLPPQFGPAALSFLRPQPAPAPPSLPLLPAFRSSSTPSAAPAWIQLEGPGTPFLKRCSICRAPAASGRPRPCPAAALRLEPPRPHPFGIHGAADCQGAAAGRRGPGPCVFRGGHERGVC